MLSRRLSFFLDVDLAEDVRDQFIERERDAILCALKVNINL